MGQAVGNFDAASLYSVAREWNCVSLTLMRRLSLYVRCALAWHTAQSVIKFSSE
jgi:hypothetical protein